MAQRPDDYIHLGQRRRLVQHLRERGIRDEAVLEAIARVPRQWFVGRAYEAMAYEDRPLPIRSGQTISQPFTVARQSELLAVRPRVKVLEVGTGSGYQAAVLSEMGARVYTLERHQDLCASARRTLREAGHGRVRVFLQDGYQGLAAYAPFDRILVTAGAAELPRRLVEQLAPRGRLVIPLGAERQVMTVIERDPEGRLRESRHGSFRFVPFQPGVVGDGARTSNHPERPKRDQPPTRRPVGRSTS